MMPIRLIYWKVFEVLVVIEVLRKLFSIPNFLNVDEIQERLETRKGFLEIVFILVIPCCVLLWITNRNRCDMWELK